VASAIRKCTRMSDLAARIGGDEFVLLLPETGASEARVSLGRLVGCLAEVLDSSPHPVTASIGAVVFTTVTEGLDAMIRAADRRMYMAKAAGKDRLDIEAVEEPAPAGGSVAPGQLAE
jgi:diguanylate cyclase (GGDEF)-like protein